MEILCFLDFPHIVGGSNKTLLKQAHIMSKRGHKAIIVIPNDANGKHASEYDILCNTYGLCAVTAVFPMATCMERIDILHSIEQYEEIYELIKKEKPDLICSTQINVTVEMAARELRIPHLMNIYQAEEESFRISWMDVYPHYHSVDSELFSRIWGKGLGIPSKCIRTAYENDNETVMVVKKNDILLHILTIGVICERKNQLEIIKFILKCKKNGIKLSLTLLGYDKSVYSEVCKKFIKENNLENEVIFKGFVLDVDKCLSESDLMICASKVESYPGVIIESISKKVPVLSTPVAGVPELMEDEYNCFLTHGYGCDDIYEAFQRYLSYKKKGKIQDIVDNAYRTYKDNHSYEAVGAELEKYYEWILSDFDAQNKYMRIKEVKEKFSKFLTDKNMYNADDFIKDNIWFLYHINEKMKQRNTKKIIVWGAGFYGKCALEWISFLGYEKQFIGFVDSKKEGEYLGCPILDDKEQAINDCDMIFIAVADIDARLEIINYVERFGRKRNEDYFTILNDTFRI